VPPTLIPKEGTSGEGSRGEALSEETREKPDNRSDKGQKGTSKPCNNSQVEKYQEKKGKGQKGTSKPSNNSQVEKYQEKKGGWNIRLLLIIVLFLAPLIFIVVPSSPLTVRKAVSY
jgi:hypothetical protein